MLIDHRTVQVPFQNGAAVAHRLGQGDTFVHHHAVEQDRHGHGTDLPLGNALIVQTLDKEADLRLRQAVAVAFLADDFLWQHQ